MSGARRAVTTGACARGLPCAAPRPGRHNKPVYKALRETLATAGEIAQVIGLQASRTRQYLAELATEGAIAAEGANKGRRYRLKA